MFLFCSQTKVTEFTLAEKLQVRYRLVVAPITFTVSWKPGNLFYYLTLSRGTPWTSLSKFEELLELFVWEVLVIWFEILKLLLEKPSVNLSLGNLT